MSTGKHSVFDRPAASSANGNPSKANLEDSEGWLKQFDRFWFTPVAPNTIGLIRLITGCLIL